MTLLHTFESFAALNEYQSWLTGEDLGWAILSEPTKGFRPVHRIECHAEDGPVVILSMYVYEVDPDTDDVFRTDEEAMDAYYNRKVTS